MKKNLYAAVALAASIAAPAYAQSGAEGHYAQINVGGVVAGDTDVSVFTPTLGSGAANVDLDPAIFVSGSMGTTYLNGIGVEVEILHFNTDLSTDEFDRALGTPLDASVKVTGGTANAFYYFAPFAPATARIGAGVGYGEATYELLGSSDKTSGLIWQLLAGVAYPVSDQVSLDLSYRYLRTPDFDESYSTGALKAETDAHIVTVGSRFQF